MTREVLFEFRQIAGIVRVSALDVATNTEVVVQAPAVTRQEDLKKLALAKLERVLKLQR